VGFHDRKRLLPPLAGRSFARFFEGRSEVDSALLFILPVTARAVGVDEWGDHLFEGLFARCGLRPYHIYHELEIPATEVKSVPPLPPGIIIRPWNHSYCAAAVELRNRAFAQNWGYQPTTAEALHRRFQTARYEPTFSFTAWQQTPSRDEQMIGLIHACLGWTRKLRQANEGEIVWVAVAQEARGQGIGQALMLTAMNALREAGAAVISVSADNYADKPAIGLYTKLGFTVRKAMVDYRGEL
jgi:ribosomal protein S18 acetylase RimI-like enzyme